MSNRLLSSPYIKRNGIWVRSLNPALMMLGPILVAGGGATGITIVKAFTSSGTFTAPFAGSYRFFTIGGGGGGGADAGGAGGGAGYLNTQLVPMAAAGTRSITVGAGGLGGSIDGSGSGSTTGATGGTSKIGLNSIVSNGGDGAAGGGGANDGADGSSGGGGASENNTGGEGGDGGADGNDSSPVAGLGGSGIGTSAWDALIDQMNGLFVAGSGSGATNGGGGGSGGVLVDSTTLDTLYTRLDDSFDYSTLSTSGRGYGSGGKGHGVGSGSTRLGEAGNDGLVIVTVAI